MSCIQAGHLTMQNLILAYKGTCLFVFFMQPGSHKDTLDDVHFSSHIRNTTRPVQGETPLNFLSFSLHDKFVSYVCSSNFTDENKTQIG